jgi:glycosyltransferase involved in cell wall biosynthesis
MSAKPALLFVAPAFPAMAGNGLAMRLGVFLEAYARRFQVSLVVLPAAGESASGPLSPFIQRHAHRVVVLSHDQIMHPLFRLIVRQRNPDVRRVAWRAYPWPQPLFYDPIGTRELLAGLLGGQRFALVHASRSYMAPLVEAYLGKARCILDLDEDDGRTLRRIAQRLRANGEDAHAADQDADALKFDKLTDDYLPRFDLILVASETEQAALNQRYPQAIIGLAPNAIRPAPLLGAMAPDGRPVAAIDFLMVGNLSYYPNADAAMFFCREVLPRLGSAAGSPRLTILGSAPSPAVLALGEQPGVTILANVPDVSPYYAAARLAVVPIRAGGGSRIKILEAFAHGRPVVSTRIGAEGLAVVDGRHLLIADTADDFATATARLLADPALAGRLVQEARLLVEARYGFELVARDIEALADAPRAVIECAVVGASPPGIAPHD